MQWVGASLPHITRGTTRLLDIISAPEDIARAMIVTVAMASGQVRNRSLGTGE